MSSTSTIPPTHVPCPTEWPALSPSQISSQDHHGTESDWELLPDDSLAQTSFERDAVEIVEPLRKEMECADQRDGNRTSQRNSTKDKPLCLKHAHSTPDFHHYSTILEESYDDAGAVLIESYEEEENEDGVGSLASSSIVMVSGPSSVVSTQSCWSTSSRISFRDAIMKEQTQETKEADEPDSQQQPKPTKAVRKKPKFVVKPIRRCSKSTGDLQSLARIAENDDYYSGGGGGGDSYNDDHILGETDAQLFYNQKAQGKLGRKNGRKVRPDEAKRLQITMAKKDDQRQRQQAAAKKR